MLFPLKKWPRRRNRTKDVTKLAIAVGKPVIFRPFSGGFMAVKVRLTRTGARNDACFRLVAADSRSPRDGRFIEILGWYDPKKEGVNFDLKLV